MSQAALLARRLQQNWMDRHPHDTSASGVNLDDSLTSLGWLQNLRVAEFAQSRDVHKPGVNLDTSRSFIKQEPTTSPTTQPHLQCPDLDHGLEAGTRVPSLGSPFMRCDHRSNDFVKPPYSYARLICMAMKATGKNKITLASIYSWITDNFDYYRLSEPSWQNSIRHNLSLNKCFEKVPRRKDEPGKGGFWRVKPEYTELMESSLFTKRQGSGDATPSHPFKRLKLEDDNTRRLSDMRRAREDKLLSNCASDLDLNGDSENSLTLKGDLDWPSLLSQDIDVGGQTIKTEAILDECENSAFGSFSPRCTETNSDFLGIDFLTQTNYNIPLEVQTSYPLDLTVQGTTIRPPEWWTADDNNNVVNIGNVYNNNTDSGLNTPAPPSPDPENGEIFWGESLKLGSSGSSFDLESLFAFDKMSTPKDIN